MLWLSSIRGSLTLVYLLPALLIYGSLALTFVPLKIGGANGFFAAFTDAKSAFYCSIDLMGLEILEFKGLWLNEYE